MTQWLDVKEVGKKLSLEPETIKKRVKIGIWRTKREKNINGFGGKIFIDWESVLEWLAERRRLFPD